ncbi:MAG: acyl dehydratase [Acidimicrobiales bacterium]|jgi:acyl dehydratase
MTVARAAKHITDAEYRTRFYGDLILGETFESAWTSVTQDEILRFAADFDRQYFHADAEAAMESPFQGLIASGAHTFAVWNRVNLDMNGDIAWIAGVGFEHFRFPTALRPAVQFQARSELIHARESKSDPTRGIVTHLYSLWTRDGDCLFTAECIALVHRRNHQGCEGTALTPIETPPPRLPEPEKRG